MKNTLIVLLITVASFSLNAQSIGDFKDVVHFKNGTKIEGVIIEQIPGESIKVLANDGKEYSFLVETIARFTRELSSNETKNTSEVLGNSTTKTPDSKKEIVEEKIKWVDDFKLKNKGYFVEADLLLNSTAQGVRVTNGYKFGRFANFGIAIGLERVLTSYWEGGNLPEATINLVYSGDILNKRITPFYQVEVGYGFALKRNIQENYYYDYYEVGEYYSSSEKLYFGGPMAGLQFGVKFKTKRKIVYKLGLDARIISQFSEENSYYNNGSFVESYKYESFDVNPGLGIRFGIGF